MFNHSFAAIKVCLFLGKLKKENVTQANVIVNMQDFKNAIKRVRPSISSEELEYFERLEAEHNSKR